MAKLVRILASAIAGFIAATAVAAGWVGFCHLTWPLPPEFWAAVAWAWGPATALMSAFEPSARPEEEI